MAQSSGPEYVAGSVILSLCKAESFQMQSAAHCCLWSLPSYVSWEGCGNQYVTCDSNRINCLSIVCCIYCLSYISPFAAGHPMIHWPFRAKFPSRSGTVFCCLQNHQSLWKPEKAHQREDKCRSDIFFIPENPKPSSYSLACCNSHGPIVGEQGGTYLLAVHSLLNYGSKAEASFSPDDSQEIASASAIIA